MTRPADDLESLVRCLAEAARSTNGATAILRLGTAAQWLVDALGEHGVEVRSIDGPWPSVQLADRYGVVIAQPVGDDAPAIVHCAVQHATPGGFVVLCADRDEDAVSELSGRFALEPIADLSLDGPRVRIHRRTDRFTVHDLVFEARSQIRRLDAHELAAALDGLTPPLVIDTRTHTDRQRFGVIARSIHAPRTVVEWHLDPANGYQHPSVGALDEPIVIVCNGGYSSSLAAANLTKLGFTDVADLVGGMHAWIAAGLPTSEPDHSHLDL